MKKLLPILLIMAVLLAACGTGAPTVGEGEMLVYRAVKAEYRVRGELVRCEKLGLDPDADPVQSAVYAFSSYPRDEETCCPLPEGVEIVSAERIGDSARLTLSSGYRGLDGMDKTLLDCCLTLTLCSLSEVDSLSIYAGSELMEKNLSPESIQLSNTAVSPTQVGVRVFFPNVNETGLGYEYRSLTIPEDSSAERLILDELMKGPVSVGLIPCLDSGSMLLAVYTIDGVCSVSFAEGFLADDSLTDAQLRLRIYSIVNSLTALRDVSSVQLLIEGKSVASIGGVDVSRPLEAKKQ